ncbi:hypothetical protein SAMN05421736_11689 [Evansella caseinilytica]|uniref:DUF1499 domain-containing protein n=1 Tax=Evansella caseinilytica TaxID=1503961 RepID=A0A1H3TVY1_9BACI|nr:DUF1499 domain-containing protein [Evansella caseinilytica]SDZ54227.1 hypothetical protein SAMN05421736_11689 [Evansella caseinilytica]
MGFMQTVKKVFSTHTETKEKHYDEQLQTRYYKSTKDKVIKEIETMLNQRTGFKVTSISEEHGEIIVQVKKGKKALMVVTVIMVSPFRTAVDFSVHTDTFLFTDFGYSRKLIYHLYDELNKRLMFVGTGLGDQLTMNK